MSMPTAPAPPKVCVVVLGLLVLGCGSPWQRPRIRDVQGHGHTSPLAGREVRGVRGVVTAVDAGEDDPGFWIEDPDPDGDDATSEGLFVSAAVPGLGVEVGQSVEVDGRVEERADAERENALTLTRLVASAVRGAAAGGSLPAPVRLGRGGRRPPNVVIDDDAMTRFDPGEDAIDFYESLEGMRVEVPDPLVVGATSRFGEIVVVADGGADASPRSRRGGLLLSDGDANPERLPIAARLLGEMPPVDVGDRLTGPVTGVLDYSYGNFKILPPALPPAVGAPPIDESTALAASERQLTLATFNVLNLSARDNGEKLRRLATTLVRDLASPDVVALQEVQDDNGPLDDGVTSAAATFEALIRAVEAAGGPRYAFHQVDPVDGADGGQPGGNIRVGLLVRPERLEIVERGRAGPTDAAELTRGADGPRLRRSPARVAPGDPAFTDSRKPLAAELVFRGHRLFVINVHLASKRRDDPLMGARQPPRRGSEEKRMRQARVVRDFMDRLVELDRDVRAVLLGDMNELEYRPALETLRGSGWLNLVDRVAAEDRYTFNYNGNSQALDHVLISSALAAGHAPEVDVVHVHADVAHARRGSDHDPVVVRLTFD